VHETDTSHNAFAGAQTSGNRAAVAGCLAAL